MHITKLQQACEEGIISAEQIEPLLAFLNKDDELMTQGDNEEQLRFVRSFGDIFITLGIVFVAVATAKLNIDGYYNVIPMLVFLATAEWLVRVRRMALPGIALLITIVYFSSQITGFSDGGQAFGNLLLGDNRMAIFNALFTALVILGFYLRYRMPFSLMPLAICLIVIVSMLIGIDLSDSQYIVCFYGFTVFAVAMWFDSRDVKRIKRYSDCAFWLHLLAAPLIVHGIMFTLIQLPEHSLPIKEILMITFFIIFFLVALFVDRRALLLSSLSYAIYAIIELVGTNVFRVENITLFIFMGFGIFIVLFGVYWHKTRSIIFMKLANWQLAKFVPAFNKS